MKRHHVVTTSDDSQRGIFLVEGTTLFADALKKQTNNVLRSFEGIFFSSLVFMIESLVLAMCFTFV